MTMKRLTVTDRKERILKACVKLANKKGNNYKCITRQQIAAGAGCAPSLITHYFGCMQTLRKSIVGYAIRTKEVHVIIQAILNREINKDQFVKLVDLKTREKIIKAISF